MYRIPPRRAAALLLALGLLVTVMPAAVASASPADRNGAADGATWSSWDSVVAWLTGLLPGTPTPAEAHGLRPVALELGSGGDVDEELGPEATTSDDPTANPQLGSAADPHG